MSDRLALGAEVRVWVPGDSAPSLALDATTVDAIALLSWMPGQAWTLALRGGYRLDNSAESLTEPDRLRFGDRVALGLSEFDAVLAGIGASFRMSQNVEIIGEVSADLLVGPDAPAILESPMRASAGARYHVTRSLQIGFVAEASLSTRPDLLAAEPLIPIEPRAGGMATLVYRFGVETDQPPKTVRPETEPVESKPAAVQKEPEAKAPPGPTPVVVRLTDGQGNPVENAWVRVVPPDGEPITLQPQPEAGKYRAETVPTGEATLVVTADGFADQKQPARFSALESGEPVQLSVELEPPSSRGQIRGLVRSFAGEPLAAVIEIAPLNEEVTTDDEGRFTIDVPPGTYTVTIRSTGYRKQTRRVEVDEDGVLVFNAELLKTK